MGVPYTASRVHALAAPVSTTSGAFQNALWAASSVLGRCTAASHPAAVDMATVDAAALASQLQTLQAQVPPRPERVQRRCSDDINSRTDRAGCSCPFTHSHPHLNGRLPAEGAPGSFAKWGCGCVRCCLRLLGHMEGSMLPGMRLLRSPQLPSPRRSGRSMLGFERTPLVALHGRKLQGIPWVV